MSKDILGYISTAAKDCGFARFTAQWPSWISDGQWAVKREHFIGHKKLPKHVLEAMALPPTYEDKQLAEVVPTLDGAKALELAPTICAQDGRLLCRFDEVDGDMRVFANAKLVKLLKDAFPNTDWYGHGPLKPLILARGQEIIGILMPIQAKLTTPGFTHKQMSNLEILCFARGWQGGTIHQLACEIKAIVNGERARKGEKALDTAALEQELMSADRDKLGAYCQYAQVARNEEYAATRLAS